MARMKVSDVPALSSWEEVDKALADIGDHQRLIEAVEADMQEEINQAKAKAEQMTRENRDTIARLERQIMLYAESNRDDMEGKKTKQLNFGMLGFRKSTKITLPKAGAKLDEVIRQLINRGMIDCINQPAPKVDKDALKKYPSDDIIAVGAGVQIEDAFWYEPDREKIR